MPRAVGAAEESSAAFDAVSNDTASAVLAQGSHLVDRALEAIKHVTLAGRDHLEAQRVVVTANLANCHACETDFVLLQHGVTVSPGLEYILQR